MSDNEAKTFVRANRIEMPSELGEWAQWYKIDMDWEVFPVYGVRDGVCLCRDGGDCTRPGKHPMVSGWHKEPMSLTAIQMHWMEHPESNIGIHCRDMLVVDLDGEEGIESFRRWREHYGQPPPKTLVSRTGGGGYHLYFAGVPEAKNETGIIPNVDIRAKSGFVIAPPSVSTKGEYEWMNDQTPGEIYPIEVPPFVKAKLSKRQEFKGEPRDPFNYDLAREAGAEEGGRHKRLVQIAGKVYAAKTGCGRLARSPFVEQVIRELQRFNSEKMSPPLPAREVERIVRAVGRY